jgi:hypothetical protein
MVSSGGNRFHSVDFSRWNQVCFRFHNESADFARRVVLALTCAMFDSLKPGQARPASVPATLSDSRMRCTAASI